MLREGHVGISLLLYAPVGYLLVRYASIDLALIVGGVVLLGGSTPDYDTKTRLVKHRGFTHTVWFAGLFGIVTAVAAYFVPNIFGFADFYALTMPEVALVGLAGSFGVMTHLAGDVITPMGVRPFDPISPRGVIPVTVSEKKFCWKIGNANDKILNQLAMALGTAASVIALPGAILF